MRKFTKNKLIMNKIRTRYAPSPTGYMHVGNLRTAIFEYLIAIEYLNILTISALRGRFL